MNKSDEFDFFREWMERETSEWKARNDIDLTEPPDFREILGRDIIPIYVRFLNEFGPLELTRLWSCEDSESEIYDYKLLTPKEILKTFTNNIICWNHPEDNWDLGYLMPFSTIAMMSDYYCFDMRHCGEDDLPIVVFSEEEAIPDHQYDRAASFKDWLEKIVRFGNVNIDSMPEFPETPMNLLSAVYSGTLQADDAENLFAEAERRRFKGKLPCHESEYFGFSERELNANRYATSFAAIARWRYEGWPLECFKCHRPLDLDEDRWGVTQQFNADHETEYYLIHEDCMEICGSPDEEEEDPESDARLE